MSKRSPKVLSKLKPETSEEPPIKKAKRSRKSSETHGAASLGVAAPGLCDLPLELVEKIIGNVNIRQHNHIRATSKWLRDANDVFVMHEFRKMLYRQTNLNPTSYRSAVLQIIEYAAEVYVRSGFSSTFCSCILPMLRNSYKDHFCPHNCQMSKFLRHFYNMVDKRLGDSSSQRSRLLYNLMLMRFLRKFDKSIIISSTMIQLHWRVIIELKGPWLGMLTTSEKHLGSGYQRVKRTNLLVILSHMLVANITGKALKRVWECPNEIYVFGNDTSNEEHVLPRTYFTITVHGSKKICSLFRSCLEDPVDEFTWLSKWPKGQFTTHLDIRCPEAEKWGCSNWQHMQYGPFTDSGRSTNLDSRLNI